MTGFLPPISHCTFLCRAAPSAYSFTPISFDPVNEIAAISLCVTSVSPTVEPGPNTTLSTPLGSPAVAKISAIIFAVHGVIDAGLSTTVFPVTNAGPNFHTGIATGKVHGATSATTPSASRCVQQNVDGKSDGTVSPFKRRPSP